MGTRPAPPPPQRIVSKSDSNASHNSVPVLGAHPLGTLRLHQPDQSPLARCVPMDADDDGPPPLDSPAETALVRSAHEVPHEASPPLRHGKGGGDVVIILDLPEVFTVGYDAVSFTAKHFGGIRDIPAGPHFFWVSHPRGMSTRCGCWVVSSGADNVHVLQWDKFNEVLSESARSEARIQADDIDPVHSKLVPFGDPAAVNAQAGDQGTFDAERSLQMWTQLTGSITAEVLNRVSGQQSGDWPVHTADRIKGARLLASEIELDKRLSFSVLHTRELDFTFSQMSRTYSTAHTGAGRTLEATDATTYITSLIDDTTRGLTAGDIIGEFQFAYIVGTHLGNDSCMQQWWHMLLQLVLKAYLLPIRRPELAADLLRTLAAQLSYSADWLDESIIEYGESQARDLRLALTVYKRRLDELLTGLGSAATPAQLGAGAALSRVEAIVADSLGWDMKGSFLRRGTVMMEDGEQVELETTDLQDEDERGEWAPEVVELDEGGRQRDLVSWTD